MLSIEDYFHRNARDNELFKPQFECARIIRLHMNGKTQLKMQDVGYILDVYNETNAGIHDGGSGWYDYQLHLRHLLALDNFEVKIDAATGRLRMNLDGRSLNSK